MPLNMLGWFRPPVTEQGFSPVYQAGRRTVNEIYSLHEQNANRWRRSSIVSWCITALAVVWVGYQGTLSKYVPYVVERDHLGDERAVGIAALAPDPDPRTIQHEINQWIYNVRTTSTDAQNERDKVWAASYHTDGKPPCAAGGELNKWWVENDPFKRAENEIVKTTIISTLPRESHNWKVWVTKWKEEVLTRDGRSNGPPEYREATITVTHKAPRTEDDFNKNVSGVFVCDFDWEK